MMQPQPMFYRQLAHIIYMQYTLDTYGCKHTHTYVTLTDIYRYTNRWCVSNTLRPRQNGHHFEDDILKRFLNENARISIKISLDIVPWHPNHNMSVLVQIMAWRRTGDKTIILTNDGWSSLLAYICVISPSMSRHIANAFLFSKER